jgi:hypothetical protein
MPDWKKSMVQTFEYYIVDPDTWSNDTQIRDITDCSISRDSSAETLGSASITCGSDLGEVYIRAYLITLQNGIKEKFPLATMLVQTPSVSFDGRAKSISMDAYTPLIELKEKMPPLGYTITKGSNIMDVAYTLCRENMRAPVIQAKCSAVLEDDFVADTDDTWLSFLTDFISNAKYEFAIDELGRVLFVPVQDTKSLQPVCTFDDGNSSILYADVTDERDLYGIPNVVEILHSTNSKYLYARVANNDPSSPTSTVSRGREIVYRETDPSLAGTPNQAQVNDYAEQLLRNKSALEHKISYSHGYNGNRMKDCVRLNYNRAGLQNVKAKVTSQTIECTSGCKVTETATYTVNVWK